jgi:hypothetical protein
MPSSGCRRSGHGILISRTVRRVESRLPLLMISGKAISINFLDRILIYTLNVWPTSQSSTFDTIWRDCTPRIPVYDDLRIHKSLEQNENLQPATTSICSESRRRFQHQHNLLIRPSGHRHLQRKLPSLTHNLSWPLSLYNHTSTRLPPLRRPARDQDAKIHNRPHDGPMLCSRAATAS